MVAARKLYNWAIAANDEGQPFPIQGTCLGHQLLHILTSNVSRNYLLVETDAVANANTLTFSKEAYASRMFGTMPVSSE